MFPSCVNNVRGTRLSVLLPFGLSCLLFLFASLTSNDRSSSLLPFPLLQRPNSFQNVSPIATLQFADVFLPKYASEPREMKYFVCYKATRHEINTQSVSCLSGTKACCCCWRRCPSWSTRALAHNLAMPSI